MKKFAIVLVFLFCFAVLADDNKPSVQKEPEVIHFVKPPQGVRVTKNVVFLFDCSTSMKWQDRLPKVISEINMVLKSPIDDGMFMLMGFKCEKDGFNIWPGFKEKDDPNPPPAGWAKLPSLNAVKSANKFLSNISCDDFTDIGSAIEKIFALNKDREEVTIILMTDGNNTFPYYHGKKPSQVSAKIIALNKAREKSNKDKIRIFVFGLSAEQNVSMLIKIAKAGEGGYLTLDKPCEKCKPLRKKDVPEIQRHHRRHHVSGGGDNFDDDDFDGFDDDYVPIPFPPPFPR